jgi:hypothetical protein
VSETSTISGFSIFLAQELRRVAHHQSSNKDTDDSVDQSGKETNALAAEHALQHHADESAHAAERRIAVVHRIDAAGGEQGGDAGKQSALNDAESNLLALHIAAWLLV